MTSCTMRIVFLAGLDVSAPRWDAAEANGTRTRLFAIARHPESPWSAKPNEPQFALNSRIKSSSSDR